MNEENKMGLDMPTLKKEVEENIEVNEPVEETVTAPVVEETPVVEELQELQMPEGNKTEEEKTVEELKEELREEIIEELKDEIPKKKKGKNLFAVLIDLIVIALVIVFAFFMFFSYKNFKVVQDGNEPEGYSEKKDYNQDNHHVIVYEYGVYKIVVDNNGETTTYSLKPIFLKDITE